MPRLAERNAKILDRNRPLIGSGLPELPLRRLSNSKSTQSTSEGSLTVGPVDSGRIYSAAIDSDMATWVYPPISPDQLKIKEDESLVSL